MEGTIGEVRIFSGNFAPRAWAFCEGQLLPISQNTALFSIIGTIYGGDGRTTMALPDLRGRVPLGPGNGPGLSSYREGQKGGVETVTLNTTQIPSHSHAASGKIFASNIQGTTYEPQGNTFAQGIVNIDRSTTVEAKTYTNASPNEFMAANGVQVTTGNTGGNQSHENRQPYLSTYYIICLQGTFPSRS